MVSPLGDAIALLAGLGAACYLSLAERARRGLDPLVFFSHQVGSFLGVWLGGRIYDATGSYNPVWIGAVILGTFAALVHLPIKDQAFTRQQTA